ncbi:hypothetical protein WV31_13105 [Magnetospirillum sp. ME-1]|uniref:hypothetical protein n=1 Tax=Magnetospirillum sp. ME-1 TaxID=1639348 RepID=UPI000A17C578|nr:hypothetical protein [Magnetospirillum sp. ME-1]ARJ66539.1 hypothetical protein WV31_13105 [Magnetospirillum sp. ME-1]
MFVRRLVVLNELSLLPVVLMAWRRVPFTLLTIEAIFPPLRIILVRLGAWLERLDVHVPLEEAMPIMRRYAGAVHYVHLHFDFRKLEDWVDRVLGGSEAEQPLGDYGLAARLASWNHLIRSIAILGMADLALREYPDDDMVLLGADNDLSRIAAIAYGEDLAVRLAPKRFPRIICNTLTVFLALVVGAGWLLFRVRLGAIAVKSWRVACNIWVQHQLAFYRRVLDDPADLYVALPEGESPAAILPLIETSHLGGYNEARLSPEGALDLIWLMARGTIQLATSIFHLQPSHFWRIAMLPFKRVKVRAFLLNHKFDVFYGHNEYSEEHIIRTQELRSAGVKAMGQIHGIPCCQVISPFFRHIDLDVCYVTSEHPFLGTYQAHWGANLTLRPISSAGLTRERQARLDNPRRPDIVIFLNSAPYEQEMIDFITNLANHFGERRVLVKIKGNPTFHHACGKIFQATRGLANVHYTDADSYDLLVENSYAFSDFSTIAIEGIQLGAFTFAIDPGTSVWHLSYREFPDFCVSDAQQAIHRIADLEAGRWTYPRAVYDTLMGLVGELREDVVRADIGLPPWQVP